MDFTSTSQTGVTAQPTQPLQRTQAVESERQQAEQPAPTKVPTTEASISAQGQQMLAREQNLAGRFDVQNLTQEDLLELRDELKDQGLISSLQAEELTALFNDNQQSLQSLQNAGQSHDVLSMLEQEVAANGANKPRFADMFDLFSALDA